MLGLSTRQLYYRLDKIRKNKEKKTTGKTAAKAAAE